MRVRRPHRRYTPRRRELQPADAADREFLAWKYRWLTQLLAASEPESRAAALQAQIGNERVRLDKENGPLVQRLAALEAWIADHGLADAANRRINSMLAARARWAPRDDFSHRLKGGSK